MEEVSDTSTDCACFSESADSLDDLLESMDEQINNLNATVKAQNEEIEELKTRIENLKSIIKAHFCKDYLENICDCL